MGQVKEGCVLPVAGPELFAALPQSLCHRDTVNACSETDAGMP